MLLQDFIDFYIALLADRPAGTTMTQIVGMVRKSGAKKVYLASASPPVVYPNVYGVDMPSRKEFVAYGLTVDQVGIWSSFRLSGAGAMRLWD